MGNIKKTTWTHPHFSTKRLSLKIIHDRSLSVKAVGTAQKV